MWVLKILPFSEISALPKDVLDLNNGEIFKRAYGYRNWGSKEVKGVWRMTEKADYKVLLCFQQKSQNQQTGVQ